MLKPTYRQVGDPPPLPEGWTEHKAPTGHTYYHNVATQQSTYTRPLGTSIFPQPLENQQSPVISNSLHTRSASHYELPQSGFHRRDGRSTPADRPKRKLAIPNCAPWFLVYTKLGRRFVYNKDENQSFWKFPPDVMKQVIEMDRMKREQWEVKAQNEDASLHNKDQKTIDLSAERVDESAGRAAGSDLLANGSQGYDSDEYEEVEVTDEEEPDQAFRKRQRIEESQGSGPVEFDEDDIAYQLAMEGELEGPKEGYYEERTGDERGDNEHELSDVGANELFKDMLDDFHISPFTPWDKVVEEGQIIEDSRYTCLPNMKARKEVWDEWSRQRAQALKQKRAQGEKKDPRIAYLEFLQKKATPKLYWPEFRRKYKKEPEMNSKMQDKDREKLYREFIGRLKLSESTLKSDLQSLLKSVPLSQLNKSTSVDDLPPVLLADLRFAPLKPATRESFVESYIAKLPQAPKNASHPSVEEEAAQEKQKEERRRREEALMERERRVEQEKRANARGLKIGKGLLMEGAVEVRRAMMIGKDGLIGSLEGSKSMGLGEDDSSSA